MTIKNKIFKYIQNKNISKLKKLITEICNPAIPFTEKEI